MVQRVQGSGKGYGDPQTLGTAPCRPLDEWAVPEEARFAVAPAGTDYVAAKDNSVSGETKNEEEAPFGDDAKDPKESFGDDATDQKEPSEDDSVDPKEESFVAAKDNNNNSEIIKTILDQKKSNFISTDYLL